MGGYVLKRTSDRKYVAGPGSAKSYTSNALKARVFHDQDAAENDRCVENEFIVPLRDCVPSDW